MADALFDTTIFIDYLDGDVDALRVINDVMSGSKSGSISAITTMEMWQTRNFDRRREIIYTSFAGIFDEVTVDHEVAKRAGESVRTMSRNQRRRLLADALIAKSALSRGEPVYTRNRRDISRFGAAVANY